MRSLAECASAAQRIEQQKKRIISIIFAQLHILENLNENQNPLRKWNGKRIRKDVRTHTHTYISRIGILLKQNQTEHRKNSIENPKQSCCYQHAFNHLSNFDYLLRHKNYNCRLAFDYVHIFERGASMKMEHTHRKRESEKKKGRKHGRKKQQQQQQQHGKEKLKHSIIASNDTRMKDVNKRAFE